MKIGQIDLYNTTFLNPVLMKKFYSMSIFIVFLICFNPILLYNCKMEKPIIYNYADGNGNIYIITDKTLEYKPVKPSFSSSEIYDGGSYIKKEISFFQNNRIKTIINKAILNKTIHIKNRIKMSGSITIQKNENKMIYIIKPNSKEQLHIEKILLEIIK